MKLCGTLFWVFAKIGAFTLGGGYAMLPLIERDVVDRRRWINRKEFLDLVAVAQSAPGILAINMAIFVGYKLKGAPGAAFAALGAAAPSFLIILLIAVFCRNYQQNSIVNRIFMGIRPAVVALIAVPVFHLGKSACRAWPGVLTAALAAFLIWRGGVSPVYIVLLAGLGGWWLYRRKAGADK